MQARQETPISSLRVVAGGLVATVVLNVMLKMATKADKDGWIHLPIPEWEKRTGASRTELEGAIRLLLIRGIVEEFTSGKPATRKFRINTTNLQAALLGVA